MFVGYDDFTQSRCCRGKHAQLKKTNYKNPKQFIRLGLCNGTEGKPSVKW